MSSTVRVFDLTTGFVCDFPCSSSSDLRVDTARIALRDLDAWPSQDADMKFLSSTGTKTIAPHDLLFQSKTADGKIQIFLTREKVCCQNCSHPMKAMGSFTMSSAKWFLKYEERSTHSICKGGWGPWRKRTETSSHEVHLQQLVEVLKLHYNCIFLCQNSSCSQYYALQTQDGHLLGEKVGKLLSTIKN